ncbi:hypothetical protein [Pseudonocardia humida]|uniref:Uncharacterized protein n=1 Tax=Pseudonocardia humida TaxID=2800819 RepID=A0ABT0ZTW4_9PSEU|nr:hypothetical protein [Pseudonocardia humida]MCO1654177.1 hypothetical protein [Pseudonocardia humida]
MTDDERLAALFRDAASDPDAPPPAFGHDDVVAASRRITARRRSAAVAAAAVIGLAGLGAAIVLPGSAEQSTSAAAPAPESARDASGGRAGSAELSAPYAADDLESEGPGSADSAPAPPAPAAAPPLGPGDGACADRQDAGLRALVEEVLPDAAGAPPAATTDVCLPGTHRYLALQVDPGGAPGVLSVAYLPPGTVADSAPAPTELAAPTASGGTVLVSATPDGPGPAPYADRLQDLVDHLAPLL